jgi:mannose-6-phosphate isomerase-like protein (cupin superfamily)
MQNGATLTLDKALRVTAPDGSAVRVLLALDGGSMAHFSLRAGEVSRAVRHRTVEEIWYVLSGQGEMWRQGGGVDTVTALTAGVCLTIPVGTVFQFRCLGDAGLAVVAVTMPPWPGEGEAEILDGPWMVGVGGV